MTDVPFDYASVAAGDIEPACDDAIRRCEAILVAVTAIPDPGRTFANTMQPLDEVASVLELAGGRYGFLGYVHPDEALRDVAIEQEQRLDTYRTQLGFHEGIYRAVSAFAQQPEAHALEPVKARFLERTLRDYRRNGFDLTPEDRARVQALKERLVTLGTRFRRNIDEYDDALLLTMACRTPSWPACVSRRRPRAPGTAFRWTTRRCIRSWRTHATSCCAVSCS